MSVPRPVAVHTEREPPLRPGSVRPRGYQVNLSIPQVSTVSLKVLAFVKVLCMICCAMPSDACVSKRLLQGVWELGVSVCVR
ncbi:hypothetical protein NFI96_032871, partial [Prochilodus magdalenae]